MSRAMHMRSGEAPAEGLDMRFSLCGFSAVSVTTDPSEVTCKLCLPLLPQLPQGPALVEEVHGVEVPTERGAHALTVREAKLVMQSIAGDDEHGDRWRWRSLEAAFAQYVRVIDDGTPIRSSFRDEMPVQGGTGNTRSTGREEVIAVEVALERAFTAPRTFHAVTLSAAEQLAIYKLVRFGRVETKRIAPGRKGTIRFRVPCTATEVAEREYAGRLTRHEVGIVVSAGNRAVAAHLETKRELRPQPTSERRATERAEGDEMAKVPGYEIEGLKAIATYLDLSANTVHRLMSRKTRPLPVVKYLSFIIAKKSDLDAWREAELTIPVYTRSAPEDGSQMQLGLPEEA